MEIPFFKKSRLAKQILLVSMSLQFFFLSIRKGPLGFKGLHYPCLSWRATLPKQSVTGLFLC